MRRANKSGAIRGGVPLRTGGSEAAPAPMEGLVFAGHPGGPLKVQPGKVRPVPRAGLNALENWMQAVITHPSGIADGERSAAARHNIDRGPGTIEQLIGPSRSLSSRQRLQIYSNMYFWRLIDILGQEYPTVLHILGPRRFNRLALQFLEAHPSRSYSLNFLSVKFPEFVRREAKNVVHRGLCADVATVERTMEDVFDAAFVEPLSAKAWKKIPMGKWATGRLKMTPAMKLLELGYPVNDFIAAVREKKKVKLPRRTKEWVVVYRKNWTVWRAPLSRIRFVLLSSLQAGRTLTQAFEACAALKGFDAEEFTAALGGWFRQWAADGLIVGVE